MRRREFIAGLGGAAAWPLATWAQQRGMAVIGFLHGSSLQQSRFRVDAFHRGLLETGYSEGRNVAIEYRWAENQYDRLPDLGSLREKDVIERFVRRSARGMPAEIKERPARAGASLKRSVRALKEVRPAIENRCCAIASGLAAPDPLVYGFRGCGVGLTSGNGL